jgi:hypothetical protein
MVVGVVTAACNAEEVPETTIENEKKTVRKTRTALLFPRLNPRDTFKAFWSQFPVCF